MTEQLNSLRVLYADDVAANRRYLGALLRKIGLDPVVTEGGRSALQLWQQQRFPLVLLDIHMPDMDGPEVAQCIRAQEAPGDATIILGVTADLTETQRESLRASGMNDCLPKPTDAQALLDALRPWTAVATPSAEDADSKHRAILFEDKALLQQLLDELPRELSSLEAALAASDITEARRIAHRISGVAALYRLRRLIDAIQALQQVLGQTDSIDTVLLEPVTEAMTEDLVDIQAALPV